MHKICFPLFLDEYVDHIISLSNSDLLMIMDYLHVIHGDISRVLGYFAKSKETLFSVLVLAG